jgi:type VI secretion system secreted protein Hcp
MAIYAKYDTVDGTATHKGHEKWLTINTIAWGAGRAITLTPGSTQSREGSTPSVSEVTMTKSMDGASPKLFSFCCGLDAKGKTVKIEFVRTGSPGDTYLVYTLTDAMVSGYSVNSSGDTPEESLSLNFTKIEMKYIPSGEANDAGSPVIASYDATTGEAS